MYNKIYFLLVLAAGTSSDVVVRGRKRQKLNSEDFEGKEQATYLYMYMY